MTNGVFEGIHGALSLSVIAFSIVFLVLLGLTAVIFAIRLFVSFKKSGPTSDGASKPSQASPSRTVAAAAPRSATPKGVSPEVIAAISGALIARLGAGARIVSVRPTSEEGSRGSWVSWGRFEGLQGLDRSAWTTGDRRL